MVMVRSSARRETASRWPCKQGALGVLFAGLSFSISLFAQDGGPSAGATHTTISAEEYPDLVELDPFGGVSAWGQINHGLGEKLVNGGTAGGRVAVNLSRHFGLEFGYNFNVNNVRIPVPVASGLPTYTFGNQIHYSALNPVWNLTPRGSKIQPYLTAGVGAMDYAPTKQAKDFARLASSEVVYGTGALTSSLQVAVNYGGGVKFHLTDHFGLRFDVRGMLSRNPTFGLPNFNNGGVYISSNQILNGVNATVGLVFYLGTKHAAVVAAVAPPVTLPPLNAGDISGADGKLCQGTPITLHATATDAAGHALAYAWKLNGEPAGSSSPDFSFTPNNAGDFKVEVAVSDTTEPGRAVTAGPKTVSVLDDAPPQIASVSATPDALSCSADPNGPHSSNLASQASGSACGGSLSYKWTLTEGTVTNDAGANATFDSSSLSFDAAGSQSKTITATLTVKDEAGKSASKAVAITVNCPPQFKRLPDIIFAKDSARVNNCGKRVLIEQAAPQAGTAYDIVLVAHRSADERETVAGPPGGKRRAVVRGLDEQRALNAAAVLTGGHGTCATVDLSQVKIDLEGTDQTSTPDPGLCGTSISAATRERKGSQVSDADKERRVEVYLVPKNTQGGPPAAKNPKPIPEAVVKAMGCPK